MLQPNQKKISDLVEAKSIPVPPITNQPFATSAPATISMPGLSPPPHNPLPTNMLKFL